MESNERLKEVVARVCRGNQREFAARCGLQHSTVNRLVNGAIRLSDHYIGAICDAFPNVSRDYLTGESDAPFIVEPVPERLKDAEIERLRHENEVLWRVIQQFANKGVNNP